MKFSFSITFEERAFGIFWLVSAQSIAQKELGAGVGEKAVGSNIAINNRWCIMSRLTNLFLGCQSPISIFPDR